MPLRDFPGRTTRDEWLALTRQQRWLMVARAKSDLLGLWRSCEKKPCRRAHACHGDDKCAQRPYAADLKSPNLGRPDFAFSFKLADDLRMKFAVLDQLVHLPANLVPAHCPVPLPGPAPRRRKRPDKCGKRPDRSRRIVVAANAG